MSNQYNAELAVINCIFQDNDCLEGIYESLKPDHFEDEGYKIIYKAQRLLWIGSRPVDIVTVGEILRTQKPKVSKYRNTFEEIGGATYLTGLLANYYMSIDPKDIGVYKDVILERERQKTLDKIPEIIMEAGTTAEKIAKIQETVSDLSSEEITYKNSTEIASIVKDKLNSIIQHNAVPGAVPSAFHNLNTILCGYQPSELIILAARPSQGKTAFALHEAVDMAKRGFKVGIFSYEMTVEGLGMRMIFGEADVDFHKALRNQMSPDEKGWVKTAISTIEKLPIFVEGKNFDTESLRLRAKALKRKQGIDIIFVDYMQIIPVTYESIKNKSRNDIVTHISGTLKTVAKDLNVPVVSLSQLSRNNESEKRRPYLSDLRESGSIEQDADVVLMIHCDPKVKDVPVHQKEIYIEKQRNGPTGERQLWFNKVTTRYMERYENIKTVEM